jgi:hypothetical protein
MSDGYQQDAWFSDTNNTSDLTFTKELWWSGNRVVVPLLPGLREDILTDMHNPPYHGHPGIGKMLHQVQQLYWWPGGLARRKATMPYWSSLTGLPKW